MRKYLSVNGFRQKGETYVFPLPITSRSVRVRQQGAVTMLTWNPTHTDINNPTRSAESTGERESVHCVSDCLWQGVTTGGGR